MSMTQTYEHNGVSKTLSEWAREYGIGVKCLASRIRLQGMSLAEALTKPVERRAFDFTGKRFHRWTVTGRAENSPTGRTQWLCRCDCGTERVVTGSTLKNGRSRSCGCLMVEENTIHGHNGSRLQTAWENMQARCQHESHPQYAHYGGRGIYVSDEWSTFEAFARDMGEPPEGMSLDRIDNNGPYSPDNCRWATQSEQARNSRQSRRWFVDGVMYETAQDAADAVGVTKSTIRGWCNGRIENGVRKPPKPGCWSDYAYAREDEE